MRLLRVQKVIAASGYCSRRKAESLLMEERVLINGSVAKLGSLANPITDIILIDGIPLPKSQSPRVYMLNKPPGFISSCHDQYGRKSVLSLLPTNIRKGLHPIGRLDFQSRGALLLTNNGELTLKLTHPRYNHIKTYRVFVQGRISGKSILKWKKGVHLDGRLTLPANVKLVKLDPSNSLLEIQLKEGRNRQIRRIADLLGHPVVDLQRIDISGISISKLREGSWRKLNSSEWTHLL